MIDNEDPITMYLIFRESLLKDCSIGKIAAQVSHATGMLHQQYAKLDKRYDREMKEEKVGTNANGDVFGFSLPNSFPADKYFLFSDWLKNGIRKVVLKADEKEFQKLMEEQKEAAIVCDAGMTCLEPGTNTTVGLWPMRKSQRSKLLTRLQAL